MKNVLITGGASGLGKYLALAFKENKYNVIITYNSNRDEAYKLRDEYNIDVYKCDLTSEDDINNIYNQIASKYDNIDILINNASIEEDSEVSFKTKESFMKAYDVNVVGPFLLTRLVGDKMYENKTGKIIFVSSNNAINKMDPVTMEYDASKSAVNSMAKNFAIHYSPYVIVNAVAPGWILTDRVSNQNNELHGMLEKEESKKILLNRFATMEDISNLILFMSSDKCNYINGEIIKIDGGTNI